VPLAHKLCLSTLRTEMLDTSTPRLASNMILNSATSLMELVKAAMAVRSEMRGEVDTQAAELACSLLKTAGHRLALTFHIQWSHLIWSDANADGIALDRIPNTFTETTPRRSKHSQ